MIVGICRIEFDGTFHLPDRIGQSDALSLDDRHDVVGERLIGRGADGLFGQLPGLENVSEIEATKREQGQGRPVIGIFSEESPQFDLGEIKAALLEEQLGALQVPVLHVGCWCERSRIQM